VAVRQQTEQDELEGVALPDDRALDLVEQASGKLCDVDDGQLRSHVHIELDVLHGVNDSFELFRRQPASVSVPGRLSIRTEELPRVDAERGSRGVSIAVEIDPAVGAETMGGNGAERRS
jgi:hypothetical protein